MKRPTACFAALVVATPFLPSQAAGQAARVMSGPAMAEILQAHNDARRRFSVPVIAWDPGLARQALQCIRENQNRSFRHCDTEYGENMYGTTGTPSPADAVHSWMDEESLYDIRRQRCEDFECGHFSQVVWSQTRKVGCAMGPGERGWTNVICNYDPAGNYGYMGNERGDEDANGRWFYFDPAPFTLAPRPSSGNPPATGGAGRPTVVPGLATDIPGLTWDAPWVEEGATRRSGRIGHGQRSSMSATVTGPGTLIFRWRVSSEEGSDVLRFRLDGSDATSPLSGEVSWRRTNVFIPEGLHTVTWIYEKDEDDSDGEDAAFVEQITLIAR